jgi:hypothetical protein
MSTTTLMKDYDRVLAQRDQLALELQLDTDGSVRRSKVETISAAAIAGEPLPDLRLDRQSVALQLDGCDHALASLTTDITDALQGDRPSIAHVPLPVGDVDGATLAALIETAYGEAVQGRAANEARRDALARFDEAKAEFERLRLELLQEGYEPQAASDKAKEQMGTQADDLFPPGAPGELRLTGRTIGETVTA